MSNPNKVVVVIAGEQVIGFRSGNSIVIPSGCSAVEGNTAVVNGRPCKITGATHEFVNGKETSILLYTVPIVQ